MKKLILTCIAVMLGFTAMLCIASMLFFSCSHTDPAAKYPNMAANIDPFSLGKISASLEQALSSRLKETSIDVIFYPRENEVALEWKHSSTLYRQIWSEAGRQQFTAALNRYKEDFAGQKLVTKYEKSRAAYGKVKGRFQWKPLTISPTYRASPYFELGYRFRDNAPYFSVHQKTAKEESGANKNAISESPQFSVYFTRAEGEELAKLFDSAFLAESLKDKSPLPAAGSNRDEYFTDN